MAYCMNAGSLAYSQNFASPIGIGATFHAFIRPKHAVAPVCAARRTCLVKATIQGEAMDTVEGTTLYEKLGGKPAIEQMANILADKLAKDSTLGPYFENAALPNHKILLTLKSMRFKVERPPLMHSLRLLQAAFFVDAFGGPKSYKGKSMVDAHVGLKGFKHPEMFNIVASLVVETAEELKLPKELSDEVMAIAATLEPEFAKVAKLRAVIDAA